MTIALIVAGVVMAVAGWAFAIASGSLWRKDDKEAANIGFVLSLVFLGFGFFLAHFAGTMAGGL